MVFGKEGFFSRLKKGLAKTSETLAGKIVSITTGRMALDDATLEGIEDALIAADVGLPTASALIASLRDAVKSKDVATADDIRPFLRKRIEALVAVGEGANHAGAPHVILMVGVNGAGKTTTIGKLATRFSADGKSVIVAAGDTFRAAAIEQLAEWSRRAGCEIIRHQAGADPSAVAFDAIRAGIARKKDIVIIDTAGRLHTRSNLMEELKKVYRIIGRELEGAPHETLLVVDGTTGQNAINQVKEFHASIKLSGIVITKLDGTSKGGAVVGIVNETKLPIRYIGVGEAAEDLQPFDAALFAEALI